MVYINVKILILYFAAVLRIKILIIYFVMGFNGINSLKPKALKKAHQKLRTLCVSAKCPLKLIYLAMAVRKKRTFALKNAAHKVLLINSALTDRVEHGIHILRFCAVIYGTVYVKHISASGSTDIKELFNLIFHPFRR